MVDVSTVSYTHLRAHETGRNLVCRLLPRGPLTCVVAKFPFAKNQTADPGGPYPGIEGCHHATRMGRRGLKPEGLPEVAAVEVVGSGACLSILPCSHRPLRDIHEVIWADQCRRRKQHDGS